MLLNLSLIRLYAERFILTCIAPDCRPGFARGVRRGKFWPRSALVLMARELLQKPELRPSPGTFSDTEPLPGNDAISGNVPGATGFAGLSSPHGRKALQ